MINVTYGIPNEETHHLSFESLAKAREKVLPWLETKTFFLQVEKPLSGCRLLKWDNGTWEVRVGTWEEGSDNSFDRVFTSTQREQVFEVMRTYLQEPGYFEAMGQILKLHEARKQRKGSFTERHQKRYAQRQRVNQQKTWINFFITLLIFGVLALFFYRQVMTL